jgi:HK97 family phage prohead protease
MEQKRKLGHLKSLDAEKGTLTALVSTTQWDRTDERFAKGAWDLKNYLKNPVVLWAHDSREVPIAKTLDIHETDDGLLAEMQFDMASERSADVFRLYKEGFLSAFSVGFLPKKWVVENITPDRKGLVFTEAELFEHSAVPIPANPGALMARAEAELITKTIGEGMFKEVPGQELLMVVGPEEPPEKPAEPLPGEPGSPDPGIPPPSGEEGGQPVVPGAEFEKSLKYLIELSKAAKASGLDKSKLDLVQQAVSVLSEIVEDNREGISAEDIKRLKEAVTAYGETIMALSPDNSVLIQKVLAQVDKAIHGSR